MARARPRSGTARRWSSTCPAPRSCGSSPGRRGRSSPAARSGRSRWTARASPSRSATTRVSAIGFSTGTSPGGPPRGSAPRRGSPAWCAPAGVQITSVAIGGFRAEWLVTQDGRARLIAGSPLCQEWVLGRFARPASVRALAGDGSTLVFATTRERPHDRVGGQRSLPARDDRGRIRNPAHRGRRPASCRALAGRDGDASLGDVGQAARSRSMSARPARSRSRATSSSLWPETASRCSTSRPASAPTAGRWQQMHARSTCRTGSPRSRPGARRSCSTRQPAARRSSATGPPRLTGVQIEGPGLAFAWSTGSKGTARFLTTRQIDVALGRLAA